MRSGLQSPEERNLTKEMRRNKGDIQSTKGNELPSGSGMDCPADYEEKITWPFTIQFMPLVFGIIISTILEVFYPVTDSSPLDSTPLEDMLRTGLICGPPLIGFVVGIAGLRYAVKNKNTKFRIAAIVISILNIIIGILIGFIILLLTSGYY